MEIYSLSRIKRYFDDYRVIVSNLITLIKFIFFGVLSTEILFFSIIIPQKINKIIESNNYEHYAIILVLLGILIIITYLLFRGFLADARKILKSGRTDLLVAFCFGAWIDFAWGGFLTKWCSNIIDLLNVQQIFVIISAPFIIGFLVIARSIFWKTKQQESTFITDEELEYKKDDLLNFSDKADRFADRVFNNGSSKSFVFGVDAPWGIGKSTFINFCKEYWDKNYKEKIVVYKFSPLRYTGSKGLLEIFVDGLIHSIQKDSFIPEIRPLISRYSRLLNEVKRFSIFGFNLPTSTVDYTADDAFDDLSAVLQKFNKKVIIVVDDLDRMNFSEIKDILFVIRKSFTLPNISYVLCYDIENIGIMEAGTPVMEKVSEFLEKFVNIKISLYLDREDLAKYVSDNLGKILPEKLVDPALIRQPIGGLLDIYKSESYHEYLPFVGDVRKLKRLINTAMMFELETTDFKNTDFDKKDLIHLLLIYIHYPHVFRKIYDTETKGGRGFFSLVLPHEKGYDRLGESRPLSTPSKYRNSTYYDDYISQFSKDSRERFLLDQVFNVNIRLEDAEIDNIPEDVKTSLACINGGWTNGRNLEQYLNLIVHLAKPEDSGQHRLYANWRDQIISETVTLEKALADQHFSYDKGEQPRERLWRILVNSARKLNSAVASTLINYLLEHKQEYSTLEVQNIGIGLRQDMDYFLIRLLNDAGWADQSGKRSHNTRENIKEVAEWIFGEGRHAQEGVLTKLFDPSSNILGLYDLMSFRLLCSADRGGDIFELSRALSYHGDEKAPTEGDMRIIAKEEMREISQKVFDLFKTQYIDKKINIFEEMQAIGQEELLGKYNNYLKSKISDGSIEKSDIDKKIIELKTRIVSFIIYQLGSDSTSLGVECGFYDPSGKEDKQEIKQIVNNYLFDFCFDPDKPKNVEYFIDYLFRNFASAFASACEDGLSYVPSIKEFTKVLDATKLANYWNKNGQIIKNMKLEEKEKIVYMGGEHEVSYKTYLPMVYKVLDDNAKRFSQPQGTEAQKS